MRRIAVFAAFFGLALGSVALAQVSSNGVVRVRPTATKAQLAVADVLRRYAGAYSAAPHDLKRSQVRKERSEALCRTLVEAGDGADKFAVSGWVGQIEKISGPTFGDYHVKISIGQGVALYAFVDEKSEMLKRLVDIPLRSYVQVDGRLQDDSTDCVADISLTERGMITAPELKTKLTSIVPR